MTRLSRTLLGLMIAALAAGPALAEPVTFRIDSLSLHNAVVQEVVSVAGDDHGGIAMSGGNVLLNGDSRLGAFAATGLASAGTSGLKEGVFSNLANAKAYTLGINATTPYAQGSNFATHLLELDATGALTGNSIRLSATVVLQSCCASGVAGVYSGWDSVLVAGASGALSRIDINTGVVTALGSRAVNANPSETWAHWGVAEYFGGDDYITYAAGPGTQFGSILRTRLSDGETSTLASFAGGLSDLASFTVAPDLGRWYFHYEGCAAALGTAGCRDETLGYADASFTVGTHNDLPAPASWTLVGAILLSLSLRGRTAGHVGRREGCGHA